MNLSCDINRLSFSETLRFYMRRADVSIESLADSCGIPNYLVRKALSCTHDDDIPFTLPIVLGIGLNLLPHEIHHLRHKAGYVTTDAFSPYDRLLLQVIEMPYPKTVADCNILMEQAGQERLTDFELCIPM